MNRKVFCEKDGIIITHTDNDVCFEDSKTAEAILLTNRGEIIHSNFDVEKNEYFLALLYSLGTVSLSLIGIYIGYYLAKLF